nr:CHC2 zinc finger domain-containing protein [Psychrobacter sp. JCM 18901]
MSIPNHILEQLNSQADLISIIGKHTTLKRAGSEYKAAALFMVKNRLPFMSIHKKTSITALAVASVAMPSVFLRDYENLTFIEAVNELSKQTGIEVPKEEQQNVSYQRRAPKPIAPPPVHNVPSPTVEHSKVSQDGTNKDNHQNNRQGIYQDSHQNNVVQSDQNYIDQPVMMTIRAMRTFHH